MVKQKAKSRTQTQYTGKKVMQTQEFLNMEVKKYRTHLLVCLGTWISCTLNSSR
jgi:adenosyl cobinamide kinase/adenosyl cobinamide phosphate guanylyltransferase